MHLPARLGARLAQGDQKNLPIPVIHEKSTRADPRDSSHEKSPLHIQRLTCEPSLNTAPESVQSKEPAPF
jgi:hypothetical protein